MKSLRKKAWFRSTPQSEVINEVRAKNLGVKNLEKLFESSRKHKTNIYVETQPPQIYLNSVAIKESDAEEYKKVIKALGNPNIQILKN